MQNFWHGAELLHCAVSLLHLHNFLADGLASFKLDMSQLSSAGDADGATFNLLIYARNLKGESERTLLENIAFNDAARRTGNTSTFCTHISLSLFF